MNADATAPCYWLVLFTHATWQTFLANGATVVGFREQRWLTVKQIKPGDQLLCYLTGVSRWIGTLAVTQKPFFDPTPIWLEDPLPARLSVKPVVTLTPETAVPILELKSRLSIFQNLKNPNAWTARLRRTPSLWQQQDGDIVAEALLDATVNPVVRDIDSKKLARQPKPFKPQLSSLTVATTNDSAPVNISGFREPAAHTEIQWLLLKLGNDLGLDIWVARNDRGRHHAGFKFAELPRLLNDLPRQFDLPTMRIIEMIDVLWLKGSAIVGAFEIESTTSIYSGLLRMADLVAMQPNLNIPLYIVAPDERRSKVMTEVNRPAFQQLTPALASICYFIPFSILRIKFQEAYPMIKYLRPEFIHEIAEGCEVISPSP